MSEITLRRRPCPAALPREDDVGGAFRRRKIDGAIARGAEIEAIEERLAPADHDRRHGEVDLVDVSGLDALPHRRAAPPPILVSFAPAAGRAWCRALSMPSLTEWKVVPPSISIGGRW